MVETRAKWDAAQPVPATENSPMGSEQKVDSRKKFDDIDLCFASFLGLISGVILCIVVAAIIPEPEEKRATQTTAARTEIDDLYEAAADVHNRMSLLNAGYTDLTPEYQKFYVKALEEIHKRRMEVIKKKWEDSPKKKDHDMEFLDAKLDSISKHVDRLILKEYGR